MKLLEITAFFTVAYSEINKKKKVVFDKYM